MPRVVSPEARKALQAQTTGEVFLVCVKVSHADWVDDLRMIQNNEAVTVNGDIYLPVAFNFTPPVEEDGSIKQSQLSIANVDQQIIANLRLLKHNPQVEAFVIMASDPDTIEVGPWHFDMRNVSYTDTMISGDLHPSAPLLRLSSGTHYKNNTFPGLYG